MDFAKFTDVNELAKMVNISNLAEIPMLPELAEKFEVSLEVALCAALSTLSITFLVSLFLLKAAFGGSAGDTIVFLGLCGAGKTSLFSQLRDGSMHNGTVTSMEPNDDRFALFSERKSGRKARPVRFVDLPGHPRLRAKVDEFLPQARGIVFVIDALDFQLRPTAEFLYEMLTKKIVVSSRMPILIACNKLDNVSAHSVEFIRRQLEKEIEKLRVTRTSLSDGDASSTEVRLGKEGEVFKFTQVKNKVTFAGIIVANNDIQEVERFVRERVRG
ncbi:hypothetical protein CBR_g6524 [Chara braunii]|uniref:Signal recognition particle receptor subunit beta n=1 Tax=Chara braunii TaxID=69332 RepID=A0A388KK44_CHABU|nr:hypothetical protein CBR_g6524 [Chara braunii]|eukprot:GBG70396.1 hypothetical protein CBR_g6524 [Chara braunii]